MQIHVVIFVVKFAKSADIRIQIIIFAMKSNPTSTFGSFVATASILALTLCPQIQGFHLPVHFRPELFNHNYGTEVFQLSAFVRQSTQQYTQQKRLLKMSNSKASIQDEEKETGNLLLSTFPLLQNQNIDIILASQSPRRGEILEMMGLKDHFKQTPSPLDESKLQEELKSRSSPPTPPEYVQILAKAKAGASADAITLDEADDTSSAKLIIGSDTIVDLDGTILEKPTDEANACDMLQKLSGNWHYVHTGVAIYYLAPNSSSSDSKQLLSSFVESTEVKFVTLTSYDISSYVATKEPMDKAGSYGIQGIGGQMVEQMKGDYFTVMGLPMHRLSVELAKIANMLKNEEQST